MVLRLEFGGLSDKWLERALRLALSWSAFNVLDIGVGIFIFHWIVDVGRST
jgi:hypothetical protein